MTPCNDCLFCFVDRLAKSGCNNLDANTLYEIVDRMPGTSDRKLAMEYATSHHLIGKLRKRAGVAPHPKYGITTVSPLRLEQAKTMLDDGASYQEVSRTLRMGGDTLRKYFPGYTFTRQQVAERAALGRMEARIFDKTNPIHARR